MPVTTGTRLERLYALRDRIAHDIARAAALRCGLRDRPFTPAPPARTRPADDALWTSATRTAHVAALAERGITMRDIRSWAKSSGLQVGDRGALSDEVIAAYEKAHR